MVWLKRGLGALSVVVIALLAYGLYLPRIQSVETSEYIQAPTELILPYLLQAEKLQAWSPQRQLDSSLVILYGPIRAGVGAQYQWMGKSVGTGSLAIVSSDSAATVATRLQLGDGETASGWLQLLPKDSGQVLIQGFSLDAGWNLRARYGNLNRLDGLKAGMLQGSSLLKEWVEKDLQMREAQTVAASDSVAHAPIDTLSTEVKTAE